MKDEKAFLAHVLEEAQGAELRAAKTGGCGAIGSIYLSALRKICGAARMRLNVINSKDESDQLGSSAPSADDGPQGAA